MNKNSKIRIHGGRNRPESAARKNNDGGELQLSYNPLLLVLVSWGFFVQMTHAKTYQCAQIAFTLQLDTGLL